MDSKRHKTKRFHPKQSSFAETTRRESRKIGFEGLDPTQLGLEGPEWLTSLLPDATQPFEASSCSQINTSEPCSSFPVEHAGVPETPPYTRTLLESMKVVCICKGIKKSAFWKVLDAGAQTTEEINRLTGAGSGGCSGRRCGPRILEMLRNLHSR